MDNRTGYTQDDRWKNEMRCNTKHDIRRQRQIWQNTKTDRNVYVGREDDDALIKQYEIGK